MIYLLVAGLVLALLYLLRLLWKQNRALRELRDAARRQALTRRQQDLHPAWPQDR